MTTGELAALDGGTVRVEAQTLYIHGDPGAPAIARAIHDASQAAAVDPLKNRVPMEPFRSFALTPGDGLSFPPHERWVGPARRRLLPGPQVSDAALRALTAAAFRVRFSDRMGMRLEGPKDLPRLAQLRAGGEVVFELAR